MPHARGERLAAGLALATAQGVPLASCLSAEDLAALADDRLAGDARGAALAHLADCEHCYAAWREVRAVARQQQAARGILVRLLRPRNLSYIGSALALAASVVVFVQLRHSGLPGADLQAPLPAPAPVLRQQERAADNLAPQDMARRRQEETVPPVPKAAAPPAAPADMAPPTPLQKQRKQAGQGPLLEQKAGPAAPPASAPAAPPAAGGGEAPAFQSATIARPAPQAADKEESAARQDAAPPDALLAWQRQLEEDCRQPAGDVQYWAQMQTTGLTLLASQPPGALRQRQQALLAALAEMHTEPDIAIQCAVIRQLGSSAVAVPEPTP
ncbi:MAG: hypothetical protein BWK76_03375 [Desulfobulbaceae bacterium A2]|nr:MAG: hypothetical protein BWK76_03375 [Desulfobulbaceae bacterium A2]